MAVGLHNITYRKDGFFTKPMIQTADITLNDTTFIDFILTERTAESQGFVKVDAFYDDAKLFVDDEFYGILGNNQKLFLETGNHTIELKKDNFQVIPSTESIVVTAGDTLDIKFTF